MEMTQTFLEANMEFETKGPKFCRKLIWFAANTTTYHQYGKNKECHWGALQIK